MNLNGKKALVTGGARRVGLAIARILAEKGADLILHYNRSGTEARKAQKELSMLGVRVTLFQADLTRISALIKKTKKLLESEGPVQILINNASSFYPTPFGRITEKDWDTLMDSNLKGPFFLTQILGEAMRKSHGGKIINIGDWSIDRPYTGFLPYSAAKAGVLSMTRTLAKTLAPKVQVNCISPGAVMLPEGSSQKLKKEIIKNTPLKRIGLSEDIAKAVLFLLENGDYITGSNLVVDGGQLIA